MMFFSNPTIFSWISRDIESYEVSCQQTSRGLNEGRDRRLAAESVAFIGTLIHDLRSRYLTVIHWTGRADKGNGFRRETVQLYQGWTVVRIPAGVHDIYVHIYISVGPSLIIIARHVGPPRISIESPFVGTTFPPSIPSRLSLRGSWLSFSRWIRHILATKSRCIGGRPSLIIIARVASVSSRWSQACSSLDFSAPRNPKTYISDGHRDISGGALH